jgi:hypothetical protein
MLDMVTHDLADAPWIGTMPICRDRRWYMANHSNRLLEKSLSSLHIPFFAQHGINEIAICINSSIKVTPLPMHLDVRFVNVPRCPCLTTSFRPQLICDQGSKPCFPVSDGSCVNAKPRSKNISATSRKLSL